MTNRISVSVGSFSRVLGWIALTVCLYPEPEVWGQKPSSEKSEVAAPRDGGEEAQEFQEPRQGASRAEEKILAEIKESYAADPRVDAKDVAVRVDGDTVYLSGVVDNRAARTWARYYAWVDGVQTVDATELLVEPEGKPPADVAQMTELGIKQGIENSFLFHPDLENGIRVEVNRGVVTLSGNVPTMYARREAGQVAFGIAGVEVVRNEITVRSGEESLAGRIADSIESELGSETMEVDIDARNGEVILSGSVESVEARKRIEHIVWETEGVNSVRNRLEVRAGID